jgi:hypothetical protein
VEGERRRRQENTFGPPHSIGNNMQCHTGRLFTHHPLIQNTELTRDMVK